MTPWENEEKISRFGGDDFAVFPRKQGEIPAFVFGAEFFGHGFGGGLATGKKCGLLFGWAISLRWFHWRKKFLICRSVEFAESKSKDGGWVQLFRNVQSSASGA